MDMSARHRLEEKPGVRETRCQFIFPWEAVRGDGGSTRCSIARPSVRSIPGRRTVGRSGGSRTVINSASLCTAHTLARHRLRRSASVFPSSSHSGMGLSKGSSCPEPWQRKLDHRYSAGSVTILAERLGLDVPQDHQQMRVILNHGALEPALPDMT